MTQHRKTARTKTQTAKTPADAAQAGTTQITTTQTTTTQATTTRATKKQAAAPQAAGAARAERGGYPAPSKAQRAARAQRAAGADAAQPGAAERDDENFGLGYSDADFAEPTGSDPEGMESDWLEEGIEAQEDARPGVRPDTDAQATATPRGSISERLVALAAPVLTALGYELLEVQVQNPGRRPIVVVRIDRLDEQPVTTEDLTGSSRAVEAEFDRVDPIAGEYRLEVESPGAKRPLNRPRHFERMLGLKARVRGEGHSFTAPIERVEGDLVTFATDHGPVTLRAGSAQANLAEFPSEHR